MEIVVCVKHVLDARLPIEVTEQGQPAQRDTEPIYVFNLADRCALEEAVRLRDANSSSRVTAVTVGPKRAEAVLAHCLARGADQAVHILTDDVPLDSFSVARFLRDEIRKRGFDLILGGNKTEDGGTAEVGPVLAELLDIPQVTNAVRLTVSIGDGKIVAERKLERGYRQVVEVQGQALITVDPSICQPRYITQRVLAYAVKIVSSEANLVPAQDGGLPDQGPQLRQVTGIAPPRPRPKKLATLDAGMSPAERLAMLVGGAMPTKSTQRTTGQAADLADEIIAFLREKGLLD